MLFAACTALLLSGCGQSGTSGTQAAPASTDQIVIDTTFDMKTIDPGREFEPTAQMLVKAMYDNLLTYGDEDTSTVVPNLATYTANEELTEFTFTLQEGRVFSDGSPVTADDVVFSLTRLTGMKGNPSYLFDGVTVEKIDDMTVKLTTAAPHPALPVVLTAPPLAILNSKVVQANGGTVDENDAAEEWLNANSAGSGPYILESFDVRSQAVLVKNPNYNGPQTPTFEKVIFRNVEPATQKMNVERGDSQVALGLLGDMVSDLADTVKVDSVPSATTVFLIINTDPAISEVTAKPEFWKAVKSAIDYDGLLEVAGSGAIQSTGAVPAQFVGGLPESSRLKRDLEAAKTAAAAAGASGKTITLSYANDIDPTGVSLQTLAERLQVQLAEAGITVELAPAPFATEVDAYRDGKEQIGLWYWIPDYSEGNDYLPYSPGQWMGLRVNWQAGANPAIEALAAELLTTSDPAQRQAKFEEWGNLLLAEGPYVPLLQPGSNVVYSTSITGVYYSPTWIINAAALGVAS
jgi:peptide/nickel transport system substrate-binding protein